MPGAPVASQVPAAAPPYTRMLATRLVNGRSGWRRCWSASRAMASAWAMAAKHSAGTTTSRRTVTGASSPGLSWVETRPGRTMDSPGPAVGTQCGGPKAPERLTAGSADCCCGCSWSGASRKEVASAAGCRLERSASPDRVNARSDVPCSIPGSVPGEAGRRRCRRHAAMTLRDNRFAVTAGCGAGWPAFPESDRDVEPCASSDGIVGIGRPAGYYPNGHRLGYDPATLSRISP